MGTGIGRAVNAVGTSSRCWILAATTSTLDTSLAPESGTLDAANAVGTSSRRPADAVGNAVDAVRTSGRRVRSGVVYDFEQEEPSQELWGSTFVKRKKSNFVPKQRFLLLSLPAMPMTAISGKSRLLRAGFRTGTRRRRRVAKEGFHL
jgi:hypothetical protein